MQPRKDELAVVAKQAVADASKSEDSAAGLTPFQLDDGDELAETDGGQGQLSSCLEEVSDEEWTVFVKALHTATPSAISATNAMGMFEMKPRRLADLGLMQNVKCVRVPSGRMAGVGEFAPPLSAKIFLSTPRLQYKALCASMCDYARRLATGSIERPDGGTPEDMTLSGVLAILHRCGPLGLKTWNDTTKPKFEATAALYDSANGVF